MKEETILLHPYLDQLKERVRICEDADYLKEKVYKYIVYNITNDSYTKKIYKKYLISLILM